MATISNNLVAKSGENGNNIRYCEYCDYKCSKKYNWDKHILTSKHIHATYSQHEATQKWQKVAINTNIKPYCCKNCGKDYINRTGLWRHKKICVHNTKNISDRNKLTELDKDELIITILKQNADLIKGQQDMMIKLSENGISNINHSHNISKATIIKENKVGFL